MPKLRLVSAKDIQTNPVDDVCLSFEGMLFSSSVELREVSNQDDDQDFAQSPGRKRKQTSSQQICDVIGGDYTGLVPMRLMDDIALKMQQFIVPTSAEKKPVFFRIDFFQVSPLSANAWNGEILTPIKTIRSLPTTGRRNSNSIQTVLSVVDKVTSPHLQSPPFTVLPSPFVAHRFRSLFSSRTQSGNCRVSLVGVVCELSGQNVSQAGNAKKRFKLVDVDGSWVRCSASGQHASSSTLKERMKIFLFGGCGRPAIGTDESCIRILNDGFLLPLGMCNSGYIPTLEVNICS